MKDELKLTAPIGLIEPLRSLLDATPGVTYKVRGWWWWFARDVIVTGTPETLEALKPRVQALELEYVDNDAW